MKLSNDVCIHWHYIRVLLALSLFAKEKDSNIRTHTHKIKQFVLSFSLSFQMTTTTEKKKKKKKGRDQMITSTSIWTCLKRRWCHSMSAYTESGGHNKFRFLSFSSSSRLWHICAWIVISVGRNNATFFLFTWKARPWTVNSRSSKAYMPIDAQNRTRKTNETKHRWWLTGLPCHQPCCFPPDARTVLITSAFSFRAPSLFFI